jgi:Lrp/AsnC family transcriptional regulator for asnA, asnC and gidA
MSPRKISLDELDHCIIQELHANARLAASEIARRTGSNERTVRKRIDRLLSDGILRLTAVLDPPTFGYVTAADIFLDADPALESSIIEKLMAMPEVTYVAFGQGATEISIQARFKDNDLLREYLRRTLSGIPGVAVTRYTLVPRILRNVDEWMPPREDFSA